MGKGVCELQVAMTGTKEGDVVDGKGDQVSIVGEFNLMEGGDAIVLHSFRKMSANIHANHCPIIDDGGKAKRCQCVLLLV